MKNPTIARRDVRVEASSNDSAYRTLTIPILDIKSNDPGPTMVFFGGVHGDEWEGQLAVGWIWENMPALIKAGRLILVPIANPSAAANSSRLSQNDNGNLNRAFVQNTPRQLTEAIAVALEENVLKGATHVIDIHSGGSSLSYLNSTVLTQYCGEKYNPQLGEMAQAFGLEHCIFFRSKSNTSMPAAAARNGLIRLSTEFRGGRQISTHDVQDCIDGLIGCLHLLGMVDSLKAINCVTPSVYDCSDESSTLRSTTSGIFVPNSTPGQIITTGLKIGEIYKTAPIPQLESIIVSPSDGVVLCKRATAPVNPGDCLYQFARPLAFTELCNLYSK